MGAYPRICWQPGDCSGYGGTGSCGVLGHAAPRIEQVPSVHALQNRSRQSPADVGDIRLVRVDAADHLPDAVQRVSSGAQHVVSLERAPISLAPSRDGQHAAYLVRELPRPLTQPVTSAKRCTTCDAQEREPGGDALEVVSLETQPREHEVEQGLRVVTKSPPAGRRKQAALHLTDQPVAAGALAQVEDGPGLVLTVALADPLVLEPLRPGRSSRRHGAARSPLPSA